MGMRRESIEKVRDEDTNISEVHGEIIGEDR